MGFPRVRAESPYQSNDLGPIIDFNEAVMRTYLPEKVIFTEAARPR